MTNPAPEFAPTPQAPAPEPYGPRPTRYWLYTIITVIALPLLIGLVAWLSSRAGNLQLRKFPVEPGAAIIWLYAIAFTIGWFAWYDPRKGTSIPREGLLLKGLLPGVLHTAASVPLLIFSAELIADDNIMSQLCERPLSLIVTTASVWICYNVGTAIALPAAAQVTPNWLRMLLAVASLASVFGLIWWGNQLRLNEMSDAALVHVAIALPVSLILAAAMLWYTSNHRDYRPTLAGSQG